MSEKEEINIWMALMGLLGWFVFAYGMMQDEPYTAKTKLLLVISGLMIVVGHLKMKKK